MGNTAYHEVSRFQVNVTAEKESQEQAGGSGMAAALAVHDMQANALLLFSADTRITGGGVHASERNL